MVALFFKHRPLHLLAALCYLAECVLALWFLVEALDPRPKDATEAVPPGTAADGAALGAKRRVFVRDLTNGLEVLEDKTKSAFRAGQQAYAAKLPSWVTRLFGLPGVIAAAVGRHYGLPWLKTLALGIAAVVVLVSLVVLMYSAGRKV